MFERHQEDGGLPREPCSRSGFVAAGDRDSLALAQKKAPGPGGSGASGVTTPGLFFGFQLGADRKMARWDKIVAYFKQLEKRQPEAHKVVNMGLLHQRATRSSW